MCLPQHGNGEDRELTMMLLKMRFEKIFAILAQVIGRRRSGGGRFGKAIMKSNAR